MHQTPASECGSPALLKKAPDLGDPARARDTQEKRPQKGSHEPGAKVGPEDTVHSESSAVLVDVVSNQTEVTCQLTNCYGGPSETNHTGPGRTESRASRGPRLTQGLWSLLQEGTRDCRCDCSRPPEVDCHARDRNPAFPGESGGRLIHPL